MIHRKRKTLLVVIITLCSLITACQSTPTDKVVISKGDDSLYSVINQSPVQKFDGKYPAPDIWKETLSGLSDDLTINIDANIEISDVDAYPVAEIEPDEITQEDADKIMDVLFGDTELLLPVGSDIDNPTTKKAIEAEILRLKRIKTDPESKLNSYYEKGSEEYNQKLTEINESIERLEKELVNAPEKNVAKEASREFERISLEGIEDFWQIEGYPQLVDVKSSYFNITKPINKPFYLQNIVFFKNAPYNIISSKTSNLKGVSISIEKAEKKAVKLLEDLGIRDLEVSLICSAYQRGLYDRDTMKNVYDTPQSYVFYFTKNVEGTPITYQESRLNAEELSKQFAPIFGQEMIRVIVDDTGILEFWWSAPSKVTNIINSNVELLPYEDIQKIFKEYIPLKCDLVNDYQDDVIIHRTININRVVLGLTQVMKKDALGEYMLIPTWSFFGNEVDRFSAQQPGGYILDENNEYTEESVGRSFLTINAIDGSIIDPTVGY
ncbi:MAG: DUF6034 family protein [Eubacteriaceae bacterium]